MATIWSRATVGLENGIVLATQADLGFEPAVFRLEHGACEVSLALDQASCSAIWANGPSTPDYWVNSKVDALVVTLEHTDISEDELLRLQGQHPSAQWHDGRTYQENRELGLRVIRRTTEAVNSVLDVVRADCGQFWLRQVRADDMVGNVTRSWQMTWSLTRDGERLRFDADPSGGSSRVFLGVGDQYLQVEEWEKLRSRLAEREPVRVGYALVAEAEARFEGGEGQFAVIVLSSAIEWSVQRFLEVRLGKLGVPGDTVRTVLSQSHSRLLGDWVLPLCRKESIKCEEFWEDLRRLQKARAEAGHPTVDKGVGPLEEREFASLCRSVLRFMELCLGFEHRKRPPPMDSASASGRVPWKRPAA